MYNTPLFDGIPAPAASPVVPEIVTRKKARASAMAKADAFVITRYVAVLRIVGSIMPCFGAWHVTAQYEKRHGKLSETNRKALGAVYSELQLQGVIRENGTGKRPNGNIAVTYSLVRKGI